MARTRSVVALPLLVLLTGWFCAFAASATSLQDWRHGDVEGSAYICLPEGQPPFPAVILNHGIIVDQYGLGAAKERGYDPEALCETLAKDGYLAFLPIRRSGGSKLKKHIREVMAALGAVRERPDVDRRRITMAGHSRGGLLSLMAAVRGAPLRSFMLFAPASGPSEGFTKLLGAVGRIRAPMLVMVERSDKFSEVRAAVEGLEEALPAAGVPCKFIHYDGGGGHNLFLKPDYYWPDMLDFLRNPPPMKTKRGSGPQPGAQRPEPSPSGG